MDSQDFSADLLAWSLSAARAQTLALVVDVPDHLWAQPTEAGGHSPEWVVGHLLLGDSYLLHLLAVAPLPPDFGGLLAAFGPQVAAAQPTPTFSRRELSERLARTGEQRSSSVRARGTSGLALPTPDSGLATTQPTLGHHVSALVFHEGYHAGQLASWRRLHRLPPTRWCLAPGGAP